MTARTPSSLSWLHRFRSVAALPALACLGACHAVVIDPAGEVAARQRDLLLVATGLMLLIIIPVMALTVLFAWRYRASNAAARYEPEWSHSTHLELVIWSAPLLIIICLGAVTWSGTHLLDPYRPLTAAEARGEPPLEVDVVALDWKWLFIYPQYGVASVNEVAAPAGRPIAFHITASSVMNSFYVPSLAGQIYAMPGMETRLNAVMSRPGDFEGFSANYSGAGFSGMRFRFHSLSDRAFGSWIQTARRGEALTRDLYQRLAAPSENQPTSIYGRVDAGLYPAILGQTVASNRPCDHSLPARDRPAGGAQDAAGVVNVQNAPMAGGLVGAGLPIPAARGEIGWRAQAAQATAKTVL